MTLSAAVMAHPSRATMVEDLLGGLDRPVKVVWDEIQDRHDTGIRALEAFDPACSHHLVLQDDVIIPRDLIAGVERALRYVPQDEPLSLYTGRVRPFSSEITKAVAKAQGAAASWLTMQGIYWGPGLVLPTAHIPELAEWYRGTEGRTIKNYDRRVSTWYQLRGGPATTVWYSWPSLVAGHGRRRCAHSFLGEDASALDVDWSAGVVHLPYTAAMDEARQLRAVRARTRRR